MHPNLRSVYTNVKVTKKLPVEGGLDVVFNFVVAFFVDVGGDCVVGRRRLVVVVGLCVVLTVGGFLVVCGCVPSGSVEG